MSKSKHMEAPLVAALKQVEAALKSHAEPYAPAAGNLSPPPRRPKQNSFFRNSAFLIDTLGILGYGPL